MKQSRHNREAGWTRTPKHRYRPAVPTLGSHGMSVFRTVVPGELSVATEVFTEQTKHVASEVRGLDGAPNSLSVLELAEVKRQRKLIGRTPVRLALDGVYGEVKSLRKTQELEIKGIGVFGGEKAPFRSIGYLVVGDSRIDSITERTLVVRELESHADPLSEHDFDWFHRGNPHISLGRVPAELLSDPDQARVLYGALLEVAPDTVQVQRATLYDPSTYSMRLSA